MKFPLPSPCHSARPHSGIALVIVLAVIVLLSGMILALFSRATTSRHVSNTSCAQAQADNLARSAVALVTSSLKQEIVNGSTPSTSGSCTLYPVASSSYQRPQRNGTWGAIPNLVRISASTLAPWPAADYIAASNASATGTSANGRSISLARWNQHYLIPRATPSSTATDTTPVASFTAPCWIYVTPQGPALLASPTSSAIGRYAYAIYDESGLLDANVAGYPSPASAAQKGAKGPLAAADLTAIGLPSDQIDNLVGWRHFATAQASGTWSDIQFNAAGTSAYFEAILSNTDGFLRVSGSANANGRTDQAFITRQELIELRRCLGFTQTALQYLGTFSRAVTAPSRFCETRFASGGTLLHYRDSGSVEAVSVGAGQPLLQSRFSLRKLSWLSGARPPGVSDSAIQACFGLQWDIANARWNYLDAAGAVATSIKTLAEIASESSPREPNFFERLKAGIAASSLGAVVDGTSVPPDYQLLQIGANIIDQADGDPDSTVIHLACPPPAGYHGDAAHFQIVTGVETPPADAQGKARTLLNRPLRSVGDLGYAFRDFSYNTLDFSSSTSADTGLLDLFSALDEPPIAAGKINPAQAPALVLKAVLAGTFTSEPTGTTLAAAKAQTLGTQISASLAANPPGDLSGIVPAIASTIEAQVASNTKAYGEAPIRALAPVSNVRTWNLMIDLVAQSGVFPPNASSLDRFLVQGERRYWLHLAIDRLTCKIIDQQLEAVSE